MVVASRGGALAAGARAAAEWALVRASGVAARAARADAAEAADARRLVAWAGGALPPLRGVWHAAGVLADAPLRAQSAASLARVFAPKAHGAWLASRATAGATPLGACVLFSSVAALLGGAGQANYAAANGCLDALAAARRARGAAGVAVQWGAGRRWGWRPAARCTRGCARRGLS